MGDPRATHRPEFDAPWGHFDHVTQHSLNRLKRGDGKALSEQLTGGHGLPQAVMEHILEHTDGVPLFIEELTKTVLEGGLLSEENGRYVLRGTNNGVSAIIDHQGRIVKKSEQFVATTLVGPVNVMLGNTPFGSFGTRPIIAGAWITLLLMYLMYLSFWRETETE